MHLFSSNQRSLLFIANITKECKRILTKGILFYIQKFNLCGIVPLVASFTPALVHYSANSSSTRSSTRSTIPVNKTLSSTSFSSRALRNQVQEFKNKGYDVQMMFVETSKDVAIERNRLRKERSLRTGIVERTWDNVMRNKSRFQKPDVHLSSFLHHVHRFQGWNNKIPIA